MCDSHREGNLNGIGTSESLCSYCLDSAEHMPPVHEALASLYVHYTQPTTFNNWNHKENCRVSERDTSLFVFADNTPVVVCLVCALLRLLERPHQNAPPTQINSEKCLSMFFLPGMHHVCVCVCHCFLFLFFLTRGGQAVIK